MCEPFASALKTSTWPVRELVKTTFLPSGENHGSLLLVVDDVWVSCATCEPSARIVKISECPVRSLSNAIGPFRPGKAAAARSIECPIDHRAMTVSTVDAIKAGRVQRG